MPNDSYAHHISLTNEQYLALLKLTWLGNWVANGQRDGSVADPHLDEYDDIQSYILSYAKDFGFGHYVSDSVLGDGRHYETLQFDEDFNLYELTREYDAQSFVDEFVNQLAERDFYRAYPHSASQAMRIEGYAAKLDKFIEKWAEEINTHGLENITAEKAK